MSEAAGEHDSVFLGFIEVQGGKNPRSDPILRKNVELKRLWECKHFTTQLPIIAV